MCSKGKKKGARKKKYEPELRHLRVYMEICCAKIYIKFEQIVEEY